MEGGESGYHTALNGTDMTPEKAQTVGLRLGSVFKTIAVGMDTSPSSPMIRNSLESGITAAGAHVIDAGITATPVICCAYGGMCDCIVCIGSPDSYGTVSGITAYYPDGSRISAESMREIMDGADSNLPSYDGIGQISVDDSANKTYIHGLTEEGLKSGGFAILDCGCGSTSLCAPRALSETGADIISLNAHIGEKRPPRSPGIGKADLANISDFVNASTGSIGLAYNGDGTKMALMDESGKFVTGERLLALMLRYIRPRVAVIPFGSPEVVEDAFWAPALDYDREPGEEENRRVIRVDNSLEAVTTAVKDNNADFAGMTDGTFIFPKRSLCPDAVYASAIISCLAGQRSIRNILEELPSYYNMSAKVKFSGNLEMFGRRFIEKITDYDIREISIGDGWKVVMKNGIYFINQDSDDPKSLRINAESQDKVYLVSMLDQATDIIKSCE